MRFLAALAVVFYHYFGRPDAPDYGIVTSASRFGYLGVPFFFMISGFVITLSAEGKSPGAFIKSRFLRLFPAYWAAVILTSLIVILFSTSSIPITTMLANLTMIHDYFDIKNVDGVYWTLQVELKFYACILLLILTNLLTRYRFWLSAWLGLCYLYAFTGEPFFMGKIISPSYSVYFIVGVSVFLIAYKPVLQKFGILTLLFSTPLAYYQAHSQSAGFIFDFVPIEQHIAAITVMMSIIALIYASKITSFRSYNYSFYVLGSLTYPLYLIHNVAGKILIALFDTHISNVLAATLITIFIVIGCSFAIHKMIENPIVKILNRWITKLEIRITRYSDKSYIK